MCVGIRGRLRGGSVGSCGALASFVEVRGCGCVADGAGSVVGGRLVVAQEVDEGFFFGTLVLAWERSQEVLVVVIVIFVVGWECIGVLVADRKSVV